MIADFERLYWGPVENPRHDLGIDLLLQVRDERRFDTGLVVGAQVKSGQSYFDEPACEEDELRGWWYRDSEREYVDFWLAHALPMLIVLRDLDERTSYWAHVTEDAVISTGKGAKILVPAANKVIADQREDLLKVAGARQPGVQWEGSIWKTGTSASPDRLRHALIVPRLVAPHPNAPRDDPLDPAEAVAMAVQVRFLDLGRRLGNKWGVLNLDDFRDHDDWSWRFFAAMYTHIEEGSPDLLGRSLADARSGRERTCAAVAFSSALCQADSPERALGFLDQEIAGDQAGPVDQAWLYVQRAHACAEIGDVESARNDALLAQGARLKAPNDPTASAIAGAAAVLLFNTSQWGAKDVAEVISGADTASSWWRTQAVSHGLSDVLNRAFESWASNEVKTIGGEDVARARLVSGGLTSSLAGDYAGWRYHASLDAKHALTRLHRDSDPEAARHFVDQLIRSGDAKPLELAVRQLLRDGPAQSLRSLASELSPENATRTTGLTCMTLMKEAGDVFAEMDADRCVTWLLETYGHPLPFEERTTPSYLIEIAILEALGGVVPSASSDVQKATAAALVDAEPVNELETQGWAALAYDLPDAAWEPATASRAAERGRARSDALRWPLLAAGALYDPDLRTKIVEGVRSGARDALAFFGSVRDLPDDAVRTRIAALAEHLNRFVADASRGKHSSAKDSIRSLVLLNAWHPAAAAWEPLVELLASESVLVGPKRTTLEALAGHHDRLPAETRAAVAEQARILAETAIDDVDDPFGDGDARGAASFLLAILGELSPSSVSHYVAQFMNGDKDERQYGARLARYLRGGVGASIGLAGDRDAQTRGLAAASLTLSAHTEEDLAVALPVLRLCVRDPGVVVPRHVASVLGSPTADETPTKIRQEFSAELEGHMSAQVRAAMAGLEE